MASLDDTDLEILRLLLSDGRRPYSEIADRVDLSPPTVSDRIDRMRDSGVVRRFTVDVDRSTLTDGVPVLAVLYVGPGAVEDVRAALADDDAVEHVFTTVDGRVYAKVHVDPDGVRAALAEAIDLDDVAQLEVHLLADHEWTPAVGAGGFDIECAECGNTVTDEGEFVELDDRRYHFCCSSCRGQFVEQYEELEAEA